MKAFPLSAVRVTGGPTGRAQQLGLRYLLTLDPDRLLAPYLREAGLPSPKPSYGNWESAGLEGHSAGHYLSGLAKMHAATGESKLKGCLDYVVDVLARCQDQIGTGYVGGIKDAHQLWAQIRAGDIVSDSFGLNRRWVPLYNLHKVFAGLLDARGHGGSELAGRVVIRLADWWLNLVEDLTEAQFQTMVATEFGGLNESFAELAAITGDHRYTAMAHRFTQHWLVGPLVAERDELDGLHANTQIPKLVGYHRLASVDPAASHLAQASRFFWQAVARRRSVSIGGNSVREHFNKSADFDSMVTDRQGPETCNTYNMLKLTTQLFLTDPRPEYLDFYERATFNHILSSQHPEHGGLVYFTSMRPNHYRVYSDPHNCFWCCVGTGMENHALYGALAYSHDDVDLFINLLIPSRLTWQGRGLTVRQSTDFPYTARSELEIEAAPAGPMTIHVREPSWSAGQVQLLINGAVVHPQNGPAGYLSLRRTWKSGDVVSMELSMPLRAHALPGSADWTSFEVGPIVLAAADDSHPAPPTIADDSRMGHVASGPLAPLGDLPIVEQFTAPAEILEPTGEPLRYRLNGVDSATGAAPVLQPFFQLHDRRYTVYWPVAPVGEVATRRSILRDHDLKETSDLRLVDEVIAGEQQPEAEHDYSGRSTTTGLLGDRRWRSSDDWFGYTFRDPNQRARSLRISYRGVPVSRRFQVEFNTEFVAHLDLPPQPGESLQHTELVLPEPARPADGVWHIGLRAAPGSRTPDVLQIQLLAGAEQLEPWRG